jgi:hypothetical protein
MIAIFYHIYQTQNWRDLVREQIMTLKNVGLLNAASHFHIGVNGTKPVDAPSSAEIEYNDNWDSERDTLLSLQNFAVSCPEAKILYFHTKGVSVPEPSIRAQNVLLWRKYLEYFNLHNWKECARLLGFYETVGTEWQKISSKDRPLPVPPHYSGNFWWAQAQYIRKLDTSYLFEAVLGPPWTVRHQCEFWIGSKNPVFCSFYNSNKNKYNTPIEFKEYAYLIDADGG